MPEKVMVAPMVVLPMNVIETPLAPQESVCGDDGDEGPGEVRPISFTCPV